MSVSQSFFDPSQYFPICLSGDFGVALYYPNGYFTGYRNLAFQMEIGQAFQTFKHSLLHTTTLEQYQAALSSFLDFAKQDKMIKNAAELVCRDEEVLKHKAELPCPSALEPISLTECRSSEFKGELVEIEKGYQNDSFYVSVVLNYYRSKKNKGWKQTSISIPCTHEGRIFPFCHVYQHSLVSAVLLDDKSIQIEYFPRFTTHPREKKTFVLRDKCENTPLVTTNGKWIALVNNSSVVIFQIDDPSVCHQFSVEGDTPSALKIRDDQLLLGTLGGRYYRLLIEQEKTLYSEQFVQRIAILDIQFVGVRIAIQTMTDARFVEEPQNRVAYMDRPISIALKDDLLVVFTKYGRTRLIREKEELIMNPPDHVKINIMDITPWYQNAISFESGKMHVLLSNGMIVTYRAKKEEHKRFL
jgi:hypothetical protein